MRSTVLRFFIVAVFASVSPSFSIARGQSQSCPDDGGDCADDANAIVLENRLPGSPSTEWDINGAGDPTIQGFATEISVNVGERIEFKVRTDASRYRADVYRLGYYGGAGARRIDSVKVDLEGEGPQRQPECDYDPATREVNCANWDPSFAWTVPRNATSGLYFARLVREDAAAPDTNTWRVDGSRLEWDARFSRPREDQDPSLPPHPGRHAYGARRGKGRSRTALVEPRASHVFFVVRDDGRRADILVQTIDATWQAYNCWGDVNTYAFPCDDPRTHAGSPQYNHGTEYGTSNGNGTSTSDAHQPKRAYRASLNRPMATRAYRAVNMPFTAEYPLIRWLERNGYDVQYWSGVDTHRFGGRLSSSTKQNRPCKIFVSQGHDEYWSKEQREHVSAARDAGVHLAFFSGNAVYWKIRWEDDHRTMVVYKDSQEAAQIDPVEWTGTWRDDRPINAFGARPENELTGTIFTVNAWRHDALEIPAKYARHRFWRHTRVAKLGEGEKAVLLAGLLGHEWEEDVDNGYRPPGLQRLSETTVDNVQMLMDEGSVFDTGTATHHLVLHRHPSSGALVFGAGTCQWAWGLDENHDSPTGVPAQIANMYTIRVGRDQHGPDVTVQQATANLFVDMGVYAATLQGDLVASEPSEDLDPPKSALLECGLVFDTDEEGNVGGARSLLCTGTANDSSSTAGSFGAVAAVEIAVGTEDPGRAPPAARWHPASVELINATAKFTFRFPVTDLEIDADSQFFYAYSRSVDDSGNLETVSKSFGPIQME